MRYRFGAGPSNLGLLSHSNQWATGCASCNCVVVSEVIAALKRHDSQHGPSIGGLVPRYCRAWLVSERACSWTTGGEAIGASWAGEAAELQ
jgi:hypothetical protein